MDSVAHLWLFFLMVFGIIVLPGMDMAFVLASSLRGASAAGVLPRARGASTPWATFRQAVITCLLNPKAYLFMFAVFPQFLRPGQGGVGVQALMLGIIIALTQAGVYGSLALAAAGAGTGLGARPKLQMLAVRAAGAMLMLGAAWTALEGWRRF